MINLEKHIKEQRLLIDFDSPREGHEERFLQKLGRDVDSVPVRKFNFRHGLQIAASIAIILTSAIVLIKQNKSGEKMAEKEFPAAMMEADMYYTSQVNVRYDQIKEFDFENSEEKVVLLDELKDLETYHHQLMIDIESNPDNDQVINALIRHYQIKLEVMDQIIIQLNQVKKQTSKTNENESV
jgi:hypothetical protein